MHALFSQIGLRDRKVIPAEESEVVFRQAQPVFGVGLVQTGVVELLRHTESGIKVKVSTARSGETFAEASVFSDVYHCDCVAQGPSKVTLYRAEAIRALLRSDPDFSLRFTEQLARQVQRARQQKEILAIRSAKQRVLAALADGWLRGTIMNFAAEIGLTHEAVYRALSALEAEGKVRKTGRGKYATLPLAPTG